MFQIHNNKKQLKELSNCWRERWKYYRRQNSLKSKEAPKRLQIKMEEKPKLKLSEYQTINAANRITKEFFQMFR